MKLITDDPSVLVEGFRSHSTCLPYLPHRFPPSAGQPQRENCLQIGIRIYTYIYSYIYIVCVCGSSVRNPSIHLRASRALWQLTHSVVFPARLPPSSHDPVMPFSFGCFRLPRRSPARRLVHFPASAPTLVRPGHFPYGRFLLVACERSSIGVGAPPSQCHTPIRLRSSATVYNDGGCSARTEENSPNFPFTRRLHRQPYERRTPTVRWGSE